jgi:hypothetical protein
MKEVKLKMPEPELEPQHMMVLEKKWKDPRASHPP